MTHPMDEIAPAIARWLAPYIAAELNSTAPVPPAPRNPVYDEATCREFLAGIGDAVLPRAELFFRTLAQKAADDQGLTSLELAALLEVDSPRHVPSLLTNSLKRRAKVLGLPKPWDEAATAEGRTVWVDREGIAHRMFTVLMDEEFRRVPLLYDEQGRLMPHPSWPDGPHSPERLKQLNEKDVVE